MPILYSPEQVSPQVTFSSSYLKVYASDIWELLLGLLIITSKESDGKAGCGRLALSKREALSLSDSFP
jgi:hypothetical protein